MIPLNKKDSLANIFLGSLQNTIKSKRFEYTLVFTNTRRQFTGYYFSLILEFMKFNILTGGKAKE